MKGLMVSFLFLVSLNTFADERIICTSRCAQIGADDIYSTQIMSIEAATAKEAWATLKLECQKMYKGYPTELVYLEGMQPTRGNSGWNRFWYQDDGMNAWISFKRDKANSDNCLLQ